MEKENEAVVSKSNAVKKSKTSDARRTENDEQDEVKAKSKTNSKKYVFVCQNSLAPLGLSFTDCFVMPYFLVAGPRNKQKAKRLTNSATCLVKLKRFDFISFCLKELEGLVVCLFIV